MGKGRGEVEGLAIMVHSDGKKDDDSGRTRGRGGRGRVKPAMSTTSRRQADGGSVLPASVTAPARCQWVSSAVSGSVQLS